MNEVIVYGRVVNGRLTLDDKDQFTNDLYKFNGDVVLTLKQLPKKKTNRQNNYYRGVVIKVLSKHLGYTHNEMHKALKLYFRIKSTKTLSQDDFQDYIDKIIRWAAMDLGVVIRDPTRLP